MKLRLVVFLISALAFLFGQKTETLTGPREPKLVVIHTYEHGCSKCYDPLPKDILKANPGATDIQLDSPDNYHVTFKPSEKKIDWQVLGQSFSDHDRAIESVEVQNMSGKVIKTVVFTYQKGGHKLISVIEKERE